MMYIVKINKNLSKGEIAHFVCSVWSLNPQKILVDTEIPTTRDPRDYKVFVHLIARKGQFFSEMEFCAEDGVLDKIDEVGVAKLIAKQFQCKCLIDDDTQSDYTCIHIDENGNENIAMINMDLYDEDEENFTLEYTLDFGVCDACAEGILVAKKEIKSDRMLIECEHCNAQWDSPEAVDGKRPAISGNQKAAEVRNATMGEIRAADWEDDLYKRPVAT